MCVKLLFGDLNPGLCPILLTSIYTFGETIAPKVRGGYKVISKLLAN